MHNLSRSIEFREIRHTPNPSARMFCFPYAGAGSSVYNSWKQHFPQDVALHAAVYPGRECRTGEPLVKDLRLLVASLKDAIQPYCDVPFAFFGHSMGAYVALELTRALMRDGIGPAHLFVSAAGAPHLPEPDPIHRLPPADFLRQLVRLNGFPAEILTEPQLMEHALPILRADFTACETYTFVADAPIRCPITAFGGEQDRRVERARLEAWRQLAGVSFSLRMFEGDHFYLRERRQELLGFIEREFALACR